MASEAKSGKYCPFCGGHTITERKFTPPHGVPKVAIGCTVCGAQGPHAYGVCEAELKWNERESE